MKKTDVYEHDSNTHSNSISRTKKPDPFDHPPPEMTIATLSSDHLLVLNKYPVIPRHFLLVTREFKEQSGDLDKVDLAAMYGCLEAWESSEVGLEDGSEGGMNEMTRKDENRSGSEEPLRGLRNNRRQLYAFYNCGEHSGGKVILVFFCRHVFPASIERSKYLFADLISSSKRASHIDIFNSFLSKI